MSREADNTPLGKPVRYGNRHDPGLLCPIRRSDNRAAIGIESALPFLGCDIWNAYEVSWLDARGKPQVAIVELRIDVRSPAIVESKSLKLYLNGFAQARLRGEAELAALLRADIGNATGFEVRVSVTPSTRFETGQIGMLAGQSLDTQDIAIDVYGPPRAEYLCSRSDSDPIEQTLRSDLFRSLCPVTGQPDWASLQIHYRGAPIEQAGLLRYLVSYREHAGFHEDCVERIFVDVQRQCAPLELDVYARFTRRGGIDINPWRSTHRPEPEDNRRTARQ